MKLKAQIELISKFCKLEESAKSKKKITNNRQSMGKWGSIALKRRDVLNQEMKKRQQSAD